ncbi:hypothetical protein BKA69DRAFT_1054762 [Paraphysoderma sedebokerense]|nr:hypothetical protein BKA69DRAFT_1054762 [Paraphysoderma sedebokerense]
MYLLQSFPEPITVSSFSTSSNGASYALMTSDGQIHFVDVALRKFVQLQPSTPISLDTNSLVFFDKLNNLWNLNAFVNGSVVDIERTKVDLDAYSTLWGTLNPLLKPSEATFPTSIFLDRRQSYLFEIQMTPNDNSELRDLKIYFQLSREKYVHLTVDRLELIEQRKVVYKVEVRDTATLRNHSHPGEDLILTELRMTVHNGAGCDSSKNDGNPMYSSTRSLIIHTGCPPYQSAVYTSGVLKHHECENPDPNVPCVFFDDDYKPNFVITDEVSSLSRNYTGPYILRVIGGGLSLNTIVDYQVDEVPLIDSSTWAPLNDLEEYNGYSIYNMSFNDITWSCGVNSKCGSIIPNFPHGPKYYLKIEMSTDTVSSNISYCSLNTVYIIRLYGLPLDFTVSLIATLSTLFVTTIGVCGVAVVKERKHIGTSDNSLWERADSTGVEASEKDRVTKERRFRIGTSKL